MRPQFVPIALFSFGVACAHGESPLMPPSPRLSATHAAGIEIHPTPSGGRAEPKYLGTLYLESSRTGHFGARGRRAPSIRMGMGGLGGSGMGYGGGAGGLGMGSHGITDGGEEVTKRTDRRNLDVSAWALAEIQLPFSGETPARFLGRPEQRIFEDTTAIVDHLSTFAIDVDTAAYSIARRTLVSGGMPEPSLVRPEEFLNYFAYDYQPPRRTRELFSIEVDGAASPLEPNEDGTITHLMRVGLMARPLAAGQRQPANIVFLVDTSCSMTSDDKLPLAKKSIEVVIDRLRPDDTVALTTYAGGIALVLPPTSAANKKEILAAIDNLTSAGGTAMESGLGLAYQQASKMRRDDTITRIIVFSDGDANIGHTTPTELLATIQEYVDEGITLSTIGFGDGNYRDAMMEQLANRGNGNYFYVDSMRQAERVFGRDLDKMLQDVAKDVKIQVAFDRSAVLSYRLVGYENRALADEDFRKDEVDAGEIGAGHQVTALYELVLAKNARGRLGTVHVRAKRPGNEGGAGGQVAKETALEVMTNVVRRPFARAPADFRFATAVVGAAEMLRHGPQAKQWSYRQILSIAGQAKPDRDPDRREFIELVERASRLSRTL